MEFARTSIILKFKPNPEDLTYTIGMGMLEKPFISTSFKDDIKELLFYQGEFGKKLATGDLEKGVEQVVYSILPHGLL